MPPVSLLFPNLAQITGSGWAVLVVAVIIAFVIGGGAVWLILRMLGGQAIARAREEAKRLLDDAKREAEANKGNIELEAKKNAMKLREDAEKTLNDERKKLDEIEKRLTKREDNLDRKLDVLTTKEKVLDDRDQKLATKESEIDKKVQETDKLLEEQRDKLMRITGLSESQARDQLFQQLENELSQETGQLIQREMSKAEEEAKDNARKITVQAIQRYAAEHTAVTTVTTIVIPSDDMKGRVIGREGRNIRAFEQATGVDVIVDDTPGVVVVSCFDPVRRAIAAEALQRLIEDGRIHPARIEDIVSEVRAEMQERILKYGKDACIEANIQGLHPKIVEMVGRMHYRTSYGQNILRHSLETAYLCQVIAEELGLDGTIARRAGFLHDIGKAMDHEMEGGHPAIGMEFARKFGEKREEVLNAIGGHHGDIEATTPYTPIVMAADAISGARPGARRETLDRYVKRLEELEGIATSFQGVREAFAIQAGREVRVIVDSQRIDDAESARIAREIAKRVEAEMTYPGEVRVTVLREVRATEYAR